jgi:hypothetical protein
MRSLQLAVLALAMFSLLASSAGLSGEVLRGAAPSSHQIVVSPSTPQPLPITAPTPPSNSSGNTGTGVPPAPASIPPTKKPARPPAWAASNPPTPRQGAAFAYDPKLGVDILFGGQNGSQFLGDTWEFVDNQWIQLTPTLSPHARTGASLTYEHGGGGGYLLLFGGWSGGIGYWGDTWEFNGITWTLVSLTGPSERAYASMTYDNSTGDKSVVLFGGINGGGTLSDTWIYTGTGWTRSTSLVNAPAGRSDAGMVYDAADRYVLLFGGKNVSGGVTRYLHDTWEYSGGLWTELTIANPPPARADFLLVFDVAENYTVLFGGANLSAPARLFSDTWTFARGLWTQLPLGSAPAPRWGMVGAWAGDGKNSYVILADGSLSGPPLTAVDSWTFSGGAWKILAAETELDGPQPSGRLYAAVANDPIDNLVDLKLINGTYPTGSVLVFGGNTTMGVDNQTWLFGKQRWQEQFPSVSPSPREAASLVYDAVGHYMLLFGGRGSTGNSLGDTWIYMNANWTNITSSLLVAPSPRYGAGMIFDPSDAEVVLFGGTDGTTFSGDTWTFANDQWTEVPSSTSPSPRAFPGLVYDGNISSGLLYGGLGSIGPLADTWSFDGGVWTNLTASAAPLSGLPPPAMWDNGLVDNINSTNVGVAEMFGGCAESLAVLSPPVGCNAIQNTTWKYYSGTWHRVATIGGVPEGRFAGVASYDGLDHNYLLWSGSNGTAILSDRWGLQGDGWAQWTPQISPTAREGVSATWSQSIVNILYFGGYGVTPSGSIGYLNQTWLWYTTGWARAYTADAPSPRAYAVEGTDTVDRSVVLFGGLGPTGYLGDTWIWRGGVQSGNWTELSPATAPAPRAYASMATVYRNVPTNSTELVLFGGQNGTTDFGDTWVFESGAWSRVVTSVHPPARASASMVYDAIDHYVVLFGGVNTTTGVVYNDTWVFTGSDWIQLALSHAPSPRYGAASTWAYAVTSSGGKDHFGYLELYGGETVNGTYLGDTWKFVNGSWTQLNIGVKAAPVPTAYAVMADDLIDGNPYLFSGYDGTLESDFWIYR